MMNRREFLLVAGAAALPFPAYGATADKQVLAFYYGWYGAPPRDKAWTHWQNVDTAAGKIGNTAHYPTAGPYDSLDPATVARHLDLAAGNGITGFIASWWGRGDRTDQQLKLLLKAAGRRKIAITAYVEQAKSADALASDILYVYQHYMHSAAWLKLGSKPVIFLFDRVLQTIGLDGWKVARARIEKTAPGAIVFAGTANSLDEIAARKSLFDVLHIYSLQFEAAKHADDADWRKAFYGGWVKAQAGLKATTATVMPGFDDSRAPDRDKPILFDRGDGSPYARLWQAAIAAKPDWVLIVSFNEWHEGSEIEPSRENGERELAMTRGLSQIFRAG
jgi:hypothetical protein